MNKRSQAISTLWGSTVAGIELHSAALHASGLVIDASNVEAVYMIIDACRPAV